MTLEEKIAQLGSHHLDWCLDGDEFSPAKLQEKIEKLGIGALHGVTIQVHSNCTEINLEVVNQVQKYLVENTRLGIPAIITAEGIHGHMSDGATVFPHSIAMASSWNPDLLHRVGSVAAKEARSVGVSQILSPVLELKINLKPGEVGTVEFELTPSDLALLDEHMEWVVEPGMFEVFVGGLKETFLVNDKQGEVKNDTQRTHHHCFEEWAARCSPRNTGTK